MILELPYPPSVNTYWRANGKRRFISKEGQLFKLAVQAYCFREKIESFGDSRLNVYISIHPRSKRRFDLDNCLKAILDAMMSAGVYDDDSQIDFLSIKRAEPRLGGAAMVVITKYEGQ
jgi:crossover junction endodeoxyribonuclease RusA